MVGRQVQGRERLEDAEHPDEGAAVVRREDDEQREQDSRSAELPATSPKVAGTGMARMRAMRNAPRGPPGCRSGSSDSRMSSLPRRLAS